MAEKTTVTNVEAKASEGNTVFTPRQWLKKFRQFTKREQTIDITPPLKREDVTENGSSGKNKGSKKILHVEWELKHFTK